jgi:hypothetical protein
MSLVTCVWLARTGAKRGDASAGFFLSWRCGRCCRGERRSWKGRQRLFLGVELSDLWEVTIGGNRRESTSRAAHRHKPRISLDCSRRKGGGDGWAFAASSSSSGDGAIPSCVEKATATARGGDARGGGDACLRNAQM